MVLRNINSIIRAYVLRRKVPRLVVFNVTGRCGGTCEYCGARDSGEKEMTTTQILSIIDDLSDMGCGAIAFTGGDPLMRDDIGSIVDYARVKGIKTCICSDGSNVEKKREVIKNSGFLQLSFDGPEEIHDKSKYSGAYEKFVRAREIAIEEAITFFTLTVLTKINIEHIDFILSEAEKYGNYAYFQPLSRTYFYDDVTPSNLKYTSDELERAVLRLIKAKKGAYKNHIGDSVAVLKHYINHEQGYRCYAGRFFAYIHNNGDVYPCWTPPPSMEPVNCIDKGFRKAFQEIPEFQCDSCLVSSLIQSNYMAFFDVSTIKNLLLRILSRRLS